MNREVEALLQPPRDPDAAVDAFGRTPLMHASERGHIEVVELLLEARAQVDSRLFSNKPSCYVFQGSCDNNTAASKSCTSSQWDMERPRICVTTTVARR